MANTLRRVAFKRIVPGQAGTQAVPAYCTLEPVYSDQGTYNAVLQVTHRIANAQYRNGSTGMFYGPIGHDKKGNVIRAWQPVQTRTSALYSGVIGGGAYLVGYTKVCYPEVKARPSVPAQVIYEGISGWDAGALSINGFAGDGYLEFAIGQGNVGSVVGLATGPDTLSLLDASHAFYFSGKRLHVFEAGAQVYEVAGGLAGDPRLRIQRANGVVSYFVGGAKVYQSAQLSHGYARLDASLYAIGDLIESPAIGAVNRGSGVAVIGISAEVVKRVKAVAVVGVTATARGRAGSKTFSRAVGETAITASAAGRSTMHGAASAAIIVNATARAAPNYARTRVPQAVVASSDQKNYASCLSRYIGAPETVAYGGLPAVEVAFAAVVMPAPQLHAVCKSGALLSSATSGPAAVAVSADSPYSASHAVYGGRYVVTAYEPWLSQDALYIPDVLALESRFDTVVEASAVFKSVVQLGGAWLAEIEVSEGLHWLDSVLLASSVAELSDRLAEFGSTVLLANNSDPHGRSARQVATNVQTAAPTEYSDFDFFAINEVAGTGYLLDQTGVHILRQGTQSMRLAADFGDSDFGTTRSKRFDSIYLAADSDGGVTVVMQADGSFPYSKEAVVHGSMMRVKCGKGLSGKTWRLQLEIQEATQATLESIEPVLATSRRRL